MALCCNILIRIVYFISFFSTTSLVAMSKKSVEVKNYQRRRKGERKHSNKN